MTEVRYKITQAYYIIMAKVINPSYHILKKVLSYSKTETYIFISSEISIPGIYPKEKANVHEETCLERIFISVLLIKQKSVCSSVSIKRKIRKVCHSNQNE